MGLWRAQPGVMYPPWMSLYSSDLWTAVLRYYSSNSSTAVPSLWAMRDYFTSASGTWVIAETPVPCVRINSNLLAIRSLTYSREPWFADSSGNMLFYSAARWAWIYRETNYGDAPEEPQAAIGLDDETWVGDAWYECSYGDADFSVMPLTFTPAGTLQNSGSGASNLTAELVWPKWTRDSSASGNSTAPCGVYVADSGSGLSPATRAIGLPVWRETTGRRRRFRRSFAKRSSRYSYGDIAWNSTRGAYVFGEVGADGWYETQAAPTIQDGATLVNMVLDEESGEASAGSADPIVLEFYGYEWGDEKEDAYIAEVTPWRP